MALVNVLAQSLRFLRDNPLFFLPKLISITISNTLYLHLIYSFQSITAILTPAALGRIAMVTLIVFPMSNFVFGLYPTLVKNYHNNNKFDFLTAAKVSLRRLPQLLAVMIIISLVTGMIAAPFFGLFYWSYLLSNTSLMIISGLIAALILLALSVAFYFAPTSTILDKQSSITNSFRESYTLARSVPWKLSAITIFSGLLLVASYTLTGVLEQLGIIAFFLGRYIGVMISTYLTIINPEMYLNLTAEE